MVEAISRLINVLRLIAEKGSSMEQSSGRITELANRAATDPAADTELWETILPMVKSWVRGKPGGRHPAIRATEVVNSVYLSLRKADPGGFPRRQAFFDWISQRMRGFIIDEIERTQALEPWMGIERILGNPPGEGGHGSSCCPVIVAADLQDALNKLEETDVEADSILSMSVFTPATLKEVAEQHKVGLTHVKTKLALARRVLRKELGLDE